MINNISHRVNSIKPSPTIAITSKARELKAEGKDIIGLGAGEPDFDTPDHIKKAAIKAINEGKTKYTAVDGIPELKAAIVNKFVKDNNINYEMDEITVGAGGKQVIFNAFQATINKGDEVLIPAPYWVSYPDMVILAEGKPVIIPTNIEKNFKIDPIKLREKITSKTKWLIINSPSNPTGSCYSKKELEAIGEVIKSYPNLLILSDDIYEKVTYDNFEFTTIAEACPFLKDRTLTLNGVSKAYSMTGWRIGYAGGSKDLIKAIAKIQSQSTTNPSSISQYAALAALSGEENFIEANNSVFKRRRNLILDNIKNTTGLSSFCPEGAFYIFPSCEKIIGGKTRDGRELYNSATFCEYLLERVGVAVVPGSAFGMENFFRISYATSDKILEEAGNRIKKACEEIN